jgi:ATP-dependent Clp protease ATP-binding subunit ClpA
VAERAAEEICQKNIILFDEIDRTHKNTHESFLNFIENGKMTTGRTKTCSSPKRSIIFMTRNAGCRLFCK